MKHIKTSHNGSVQKNTRKKAFQSSLIRGAGAKGDAWIRPARQEMRDHVKHEPTSDCPSKEGHPLRQRSGSGRGRSRWPTPETTHPNWRQTKNCTYMSRREARNAHPQAASPNQNTKSCQTHQHRSRTAPRENPEHHPRPRMAKCPLRSRCPGHSQATEAAIPYTKTSHYIDVSAPPKKHNELN